jgi:hypothetical protein
MSVSVFFTLRASVEISNMCLLQVKVQTLPLLTHVTFTHSIRIFRGGLLTIFHTLTTK